jgi:hypothetical protein
MPPSPPVATAVETTFVAPLALADALALASPPVPAVPT